MILDIEIHNDMNINVHIDINMNSGTLISIDMNIYNYMGYYLSPTPYWLFPIGCFLFAYVRSAHLEWYASYPSLPTTGLPCQRHALAG